MKAGTQPAVLLQSEGSDGPRHAFRFLLHGEHPFLEGDVVYLLPAISGGSGKNGGDRPTRPFERISPEEKQKLLELYKEHPEIREVLDESGWTLSEKRNFFEHLLQRVGQDPKRYLGMAKALQALQAAGWSYDSQYYFIPHLAELAGHQSDWAYRSLDKATRALKILQPDPGMQFRLLYGIVERSAAYAGQAFENLPGAIRALDITGWKAERKFRFLSFLSERAGNVLGIALQRLPETLRELQGLPGEFHRNFRFLVFLVINAGHRPPFFRDTSMRRVIHFDPLQRASVPPVELQPWREYYPVRALEGRIPASGLLIPVRSAQNFPAGIEHWEVKYVEGNRLILKNGQVTDRYRMFSPLEGQRVLQSALALHFPLRVGDKVVFWPEQGKSLLERLWGSLHRFLK
jgi:hypothetical protein